MELDNKLSNRVWFDLSFPIKEKYKPAVGEAPKNWIKTNPTVLDQIIAHLARPSEQSSLRA